MKNTKRILIAASLFFSLQVMAQTVSNGIQLYDMNLINKAKKALQSEAKAGSIESWFYLGKIYLESEKLDSAKICFQSIATANPKSTLSAIGMSLLESQAGRKSAALAMLDKLLKPAKSAKDVLALTELGNARFAAGDSVNWIAPIELAESLKKYPRAFMAAGDNYMTLGDKYPDRQFHGKSASQYQQVIYFEPNNLVARSKLSELYIRSKNDIEGERYIKEMLNIDPNFLPALRQAGEYYYSVGQYPLAADYYSKYITAIEPTTKDLGRYSYILFFNKKYDKVWDNVNKVLAKEPDQQIMLRLKGYSGYELGKYAEGLQAMAKFFNLRSGKDDKKIADDYEYYGKLLLKNNQEKPGIENLLKAVELDPKKSYLYDEIVKIYENNKMYLEAASLYDKIIALGKTKPAGNYYYKGLNLLKYAKSLMGTPDSLKADDYLKQADDAYAKVCEYSPQSHIGFLLRAQVAYFFDKDSKLGLAKPYYEKALALSETNQGKNKDAIIESCWYLGSFFFSKWDDAVKAKDINATNEYKSESLKYWNKILALEPTHEKAVTAVTALNK